MSREFVEAVAKNNNLGAAEIYKEVMIQKVGAALEKKEKRGGKGVCATPCRYAKKIGKRLRANKDRRHYLSK